GVNEQIDRRLAGALGAHDATRNLEPLIEDEGKQGVVNGNGGNGNRRKGNRGNGNGGNGNVGANGNSNGNGGGRTYEVDDRSVLSKKQGPKDVDRVVELGCERK
ncbi:hypothetical protein Tco_1180815, partial [Tanacetum coccineum]